MIYQILKESWISISAYKLRTFLTMLGILIGVAAVVMMVAAGQTVQNEITKTKRRVFMTLGRKFAAAVQR